MFLLVSIVNYGILSLWPTRNKLIIRPYTPEQPRTRQNPTQILLWKWLFDFQLSLGQDIKKIRMREMGGGVSVPKDKKIRNLEKELWKMWGMRAAQSKLENLAMLKHFCSLCIYQHNRHGFRKSSRAPTSSWFPPWWFKRTWCFCGRIFFLIGCTTCLGTTEPRRVCLTLLILSLEEKKIIFHGFKAITRDMIKAAKTYRQKNTRKTNHLPLDGISSSKSISSKFNWFIILPLLG